MKTYQVEITETLQKIIEIEASDLEDAEAIANEQWSNGEYILDADNFTGVEFKANTMQENKEFERIESSMPINDTPQKKVNDNEMPQNMIKVILVKPMKKPEVLEIASDLKSMQDIVGGLIEAVYPYDEQVAIICNEEGKNLGLSLNRSLKSKDGEIIDIIAGDFFIADCNGENFGSLNDEQLKWYSKLFENPELFYKIDGEIKSLPVLPQKQKDCER